MKYLEDIETDKFQLEVYECSCGFHLGVDFTYLDQVGPVTFTCPSCNWMIKIDHVDDPSCRPQIIPHDKGGIVKKA